MDGGTLDNMVGLYISGEDQFSTNYVFFMDENGIV